MKKLFFGACVVLLLAAGISAFAQKTKTQLQTEINSNFPDNTTGLITPAITRTTTNDFVLSWVDWVTCSGIGANGSPIWNNGSGLYQCQSFPWTVAQGGTGIVSGTTGGIPYFSASTTIASSGTLTANLPVIGGGAGVSPGVGTVTGNTTKFATSTGTLTANDCVKIDANGNFIDAGGVCAGAGSATIVSPQGRLTLASVTPVMSTTVAGATTVYYDCYDGNQVPYYTGSTDVLDTISGCEVSDAMVSAASAGQIVNNNVYDVFWVHGGANRICIAMSVAGGGGGGWSADTGGSNTARGTGFSQLDRSRGYVTNHNSIANCFNAATNYGPVSANQGTYLGTIYATANGQTTYQFGSAATGGGAALLYVWNAYNRVKVSTTVVDSTTLWHTSDGNVHNADDSTNNRISWVSGLAEDTVSINYWQQIGTTNPCGGTCTWQIISIGFVLNNSGNVAPDKIALVYSNATAAAAVGNYVDTKALNHTYNPRFGINFVQAQTNTDGGGFVGDFYGGQRMSFSGDLRL